MTIYVYVHMLGIQEEYLRVNKQRHSTLVPALTFSNL